MRLGRTSLQILLMTNAAELRFRRRLQKPGYSNYRRMLCTSDTKFLQSAASKQVFHYTSPTKALKYDPKAKNLVVTYDLFLQNWRMVNCDDVDVIATIKTSPDPQDFWKYFYASLKPMSGTNKAQFMNK